MSMLVRLGGMSSVFAGGCIAEKVPPTNICTQCVTGPEYTPLHGNQVLLGPFLKRFAPALMAPSPMLGGLASQCVASDVMAVLWPVLPASWG